MLKPRGLCHRAGDSRDGTRGQQPGNTGRGSAGLARQMLGWAMPPGSWHVAGHSAGVAEPETVADGQRFLSLPPDCAPAAFSPGDARGRGRIHAGAEAGCAVPLRHQEPEQKPT